jgi:MFS family permease
MLRSLVGITTGWLAISLLSDGLSTIIVPALVVRMTETDRATILGLAGFVALGIGAAVLPLAGAASDRLRSRLGRRPQIAFGLALAVSGLAILAAADTVALVAGGFVVVAVGVAVAQAAQQTLIPDLVPISRHGRAAGAKGFMDLLGAVVGFVVLGGLVAAGRLDLALAAAAVLVTAAVLATFALVREPASSRRSDLPMPQAERPRADLRRDFFLAVLARFVFLVATFGIGRFLFLFVLERSASNAEEAAGMVGALLASLALMTALVALPSGLAVERFGRGPVVHAGGLVAAAGALAFAFAAGWAGIIAGGILLAVGSAMFSAGNWATTTQLSPPPAAGWYMGVASLGTAGAAAVAGLFGPLLDLGSRLWSGSGYTLLFLTAAGFYLGSSMISRAITESATTETTRSSGVEAHASPP